MLQTIYVCLILERILCYCVMFLSVLAILSYRQCLQSWILVSYNILYVLKYRTTGKCFWYNIVNMLLLLDQTTSEIWINSNSSRHGCVEQIKKRQTFLSHDIALETVSSYKYLGCVLDEYLNYSVTAKYLI